MLTTLDGGRLSIAAMRLGGAQGTYELALKYARERPQFGQPISKFQAIAFKLADSAMEIECARNLLYKACWLRNNKQPFEKQAAIVRKDSRVPFERSTTGGRKTLYSYLSLASGVQGRHMEPLIVHIEKSDTQDLSAHDGEEFNYVLEGRVRLTLHEKTHELGPGDSVYYHSSLPHLITARNDRAIILAVLYE